MFDDEQRNNSEQQEMSLRQDFLKAAIEFARYNGAHIGHMSATNIHQIPTILGLIPEYSRREIIPEMLDFIDRYHELSGIDPT